MTLKIPHHLGVQAETFKAAIEDHLAELNAWADHMDRVAQDEANGVTDPVQKHQPYPAPHPHDPLIGRAVKLDEATKRYVADYVIEEPPPVDQAKLFEDKRQKLLRDLAVAESGAHGRNLHPNKSRLFGLRVSEAMVTPEQLRTEEHNQLLAQAAELRRKERVIHLHAAQQEAEIADLTPETIDGWVMKVFP